MLDRMMIILEMGAYFAIKDQSKGMVKNRGFNLYTGDVYWKTAGIASTEIMDYMGVIDKNDPIDRTVAFGIGSLLVSKGKVNVVTHGLVLNYLEELLNKRYSPSDIEYKLLKYQGMNMFDSITSLNIFGTAMETAYDVASCSFSNSITPSFKGLEQSFNDLNNTMRENNCLKRYELNLSIPEYCCVDYDVCLMDILE